MALSCNGCSPTFAGRGFLLVIGCWSFVIGIQYPLIDFNRFNNQLIIHAELEGQLYRYQLDSTADYIINNLEKIYFDLELMNSSKFAILNRIQWLGDQIFSPLDKLIQDCQEINFIITQNLVKCPFDLLHYRRKPLFLQKPVIYSFSKVNSRFNFSEDWSGLIVSDPTTDPENGAAIVQEILADSVYYNIEEFTLEEFSLIEPQDLVFISAHGLVYIDYNEQQDYIRLGQEAILPTHLSQLSAKLIYLDSCQLGVSHPFIQSLKRSKTQYYIAPILSNEAGNSSTQTIELFFESLKAGLSPSWALFKARTQLYQQFKQTDAYLKLMWRCFPFRVYYLK